jgi:transposase
VKSGIDAIGFGRTYRHHAQIEHQLVCFISPHRRGPSHRRPSGMRGNRYLRKILVHVARAVVLRSKRDRIAIGAWITSLEMRASRNVLIVAMANKLARIAWAVLSTGQDYRAVPDTGAA